MGSARQKRGLACEGWRNPLETKRSKPNFDYKKVFFSYYCWPLEEFLFKNVLPPLAGKSQEGGADDVIAAVRSPIFCEH